MQFLVKQDVYRDKLTGFHYTKDDQFRPVAFIDGDHKCTTKGVVLRPFGDHPDLDWDQFNTLFDTVDCTEQFGYPVGCFGQTLFVTEDALESRFIPLGVMYQPVDLEESVRHYEEEGCDFQDKTAVAARARNSLHSFTGNLSDCVWYTLYKSYVANMTEQEADPRQLSLF